MSDAVSQFLPWMAIPLAALSIVMLWRRGALRLKAIDHDSMRPQHALYYFAVFALALIAQIVAARLVLSWVDDAGSTGAMPRDVATSEGADDVHVDRLRRGAAVGLPASMVTLGVIGIAVLATHRSNSVGGRPNTSLKRATRDGVIGLVAVLPVYFSVAHLAGIVEQFVTGEPPGSTSHDVLESILRVGTEHPGLLVLVVLGAAVATPLVEEAMYRFALQNALVLALRSGWWGIVATAMLFAIMHLGVVPWRALPPLVLLGVAFGLLYERSGSLMAAVIMHGLFNALMIALTLVIGA